MRKGVGNEGWRKRGRRGRGCKEKEERREERRKGGEKERKRWEGKEGREGKRGQRSERIWERRVRVGERNGECHEKVIASGRYKRASSLTFCYTLRRGSIGRQENI